MSVSLKIEIIKGGNVFCDLNGKDADIKQTKTLLAADIIRILDKENARIARRAK